MAAIPAVACTQKSVDLADSSFIACMRYLSIFKLPIGRIRLSSNRSFWKACNSPKTQHWFIVKISMPSIELFGLIWWNTRLSTVRTAYPLSTHVLYYISFHCRLHVTRSLESRCNRKIDLITKKFNDTRHDVDVQWHSLLVEVLCFLWVGTTAVPISTAKMRYYVPNLRAGESQCNQRYSWLKIFYIRQDPQLFWDVNDYFPLRQLSTIFYQQIKIMSINENWKL